MFPIAPPLLPASHPNRAYSCEAALRANFQSLAGGPADLLVAAAVQEGWTLVEVSAAVAAMRARMK